MILRSIIALGIVASSFAYLTTKNVVNLPLNIGGDNVNTPPNLVIEPIKQLADKKVNKLSIPGSQLVVLQGQIMENSRAIIEELKEKEKLGKDLYLLIDSPGGSVMDGAMIISAMQASPVKIHTVCMGMCASMAFVIHQYGTTRLAADRAILMAHPASGGVQGTLEQMNSRLGLITRYVDKMDQHISSRVGMSMQEFKALTVSEFWVDAEDALEKKFVDELVDVNSDVRSLPSLVPPPSQSNNIKPLVNIIW